MLKIDGPGSQFEQSLLSRTSLTMAGHAHQNSGGRWYSNIPPCVVNMSPQSMQTDILSHNPMSIISQSQSRHKKGGYPNFSFSPSALRQKSSFCHPKAAREETQNALSLSQTWRTIKEQSRIREARSYKKVTGAEGYYRLNAERQDKKITRPCTYYKWLECARRVSRRITSDSGLPKFQPSPVGFRVPPAREEI